MAPNLQIRVFGRGHAMPRRPGSKISRFKPPPAADGWPFEQSIAPNVPLLLQTRTMPIEMRPFTKEDRDGSGDQDLTAHATWFLVQHMSCSRPIAASSLPTPDAIVGTVKLMHAMPHGSGEDDPVRKAKSFICSLSNTDESILFSPGDQSLSDPACLLWHSAHRCRIEGLFRLQVVVPAAFLDIFLSVVR